MFTFLIENGYLTNKKHITTGSIIAGFMIHLGYTSDAVIYTFLQAPIRKTLSKMVCQCRDNEGENSQQNRFHIRGLNLNLQVRFKKQHWARTLVKKLNGGHTN